MNAPPVSGTVVIDASGSSINGARGRALFIANNEIPENEGWRLDSEGFDSSERENQAGRVWYCRLVYVRSTELV